MRIQVLSQLTLCVETDLSDPPKPLSIGVYNRTLQIGVVELDDFDTVVKRLAELRVST